MLTIRKTGEGYYLASLAKKQEELDQKAAHLVKQELSPIVKPHREITFDIKGVNSISSGGYKMLQELIDLARDRHCKFKIINASAGISGKLAAMTAKPVRQSEESEI